MIIIELPKPSGQVAAADVAALADALRKAGIACRADSVIFIDRDGVRSTRTPVPPTTTAAVELWWD